MNYMNCMVEILFFFSDSWQKFLKLLLTPELLFFLFENGTPIWLTMYLIKKLETHTYREQASEVLFHIGDTKKKKRRTLGIVDYL